MEQLSGLDAAFLSLDTATTAGHVGGVHVLEGTPTDGAEPLTLERLTAVVAERLHLVPPMRRRVVEVPLGLDQPYWLEDDTFDLEFHVRELALPAPGSRHQLTEQVARIHARPLDRRRPLWELYLVHGLEGGRMALYAKFHHAMIDGVAGQEVTAALLDPSPHGRALDPPGQAWVAERPPGALPLLARTGLSYATRPLRVARLASELTRSALRLGRGGAGPEVLFRAASPAPATPFNRSVTPHRRVALLTLPFADVRAVKDAARVTVNDVVLALAAGGLRRWLLAHDALPDEPLVAAVPVSVRAGSGSGGADGALGNRVSFMLTPLPTHLADAADRLEVVHEATLRAKHQHGALPADLIADVYALTTPALVGLATRANATLRLLERAGPFNLFVSNVPGPQVPLYVAGHRVEAMYPVSAITDGQGLNLTVISYAGGLHVGLVADRELVPDLDDLTGHLADELADLLTLV